MPFDNLPEDSRKLLEDFPNAWKSLQDQLEAKLPNPDTIKNLEEFMGQVEDINKAVSQARAIETTLKEELEQVKEGRVTDKKALDKRIEELELEISKKSSKTNEEVLVDLNDRFAIKRAKLEASDLYKRFNGWCKHGDDVEDIDLKQLSLDIKNTLRTDRDVQGGYLLPEVMDNELRKDIREISPMRLFCRVRTMPSKTMQVPRRAKGIDRAMYEGEGEEGSEGISTYVNEEVTCFRQTHTVPITKDMIYSSAFDIEQEAMSDVLEAFAAGEGLHVVKGTGQKGPSGIINDDRIQVIDSKTAGALAFEDFATIIGQLKRGQRPGFLMNRKTLSEIWKLKGSDDHPLWAPVSMGGATPATIFSYPYNSDVIDLDNHDPTTSNTKPIVFGDFMRGYEIFDMVGVELIRDDYSKKRQNIVEFTFHRYNTGQVILAEAIKILKIK